ncbi:hypothetical protein TRICI_000535 [Trichomonascus ciferrii]|uniref:Mediator of RNA polymerase II transcription subunit 10 n=1 Tax=Trichomonascus ciferrii TaxID=44093 RepID=A0A642VD59_9ASCO|nr:hypothetical protein TRICI_000535 [Trichomonascus ciferrii]
MAEEVQEQLKQIIETQIELGILIHDFEATVEGKEGLLERINVLTNQFQQLNQSAYKNLQHKTVPLDIVEYIENGRNPDVYTREFVELLAKQNQYVNGKMHAMNNFRNILSAQIKDAYPDLESSINDINQRTAFSS